MIILALLTLEELGDRYFLFFYHQHVCRILITLTRDVDAPLYF